MEDVKSILSIISLSIVSITALIKVLEYLRIKWRSQYAAKVLKTSFSNSEVRQATRYYIPTFGQNKSPSEGDELLKLVSRQELIPKFIKDVFDKKNDENRFYLVLGGSGMGKTTFMINLFLKYQSSWKLLSPKYDIILYPFGDQRTLNRIKKIEFPHKTIVLLDALDEDTLVQKNYHGRIDELVEILQDFRAVIISCRTQFFPSEEDELNEVDIPKLGTLPGFQKFEKVYLSPFSKKDIKKYLYKRFSLWAFKKRKLSLEIVERSPNLMVRPMILAYIEDLVNYRKPFKLVFQIYEELIYQWIKREAERVIFDRREIFKKNLLYFSRHIAMDIYNNFRDEGVLFLKEKEPELFAEKFNIQLHISEMKGRSLLNRNAQGRFKFAHRSIFEFFIAFEYFNNKSFREDSDLNDLDQATAFLEEMKLFPEMVYVEGGFLNFDTDKKTENDSVKEIEVGSFLIGKYQITQEEWERVMGGNPSYFNNPEFPVENVSFEDVQLFIDKLNTITGESYRLPTEAEWEFAACGGVKSKGFVYSGGNSPEIGWFWKNSGNMALTGIWDPKVISANSCSTHIVGTKLPNELGIFDMSGNVWEWCSDWYYDEYPASKLSDKNVISRYGKRRSSKNSNLGHLKVLRGGSCFSEEICLRSDFRNADPPSVRSDDVGFRLAKNVKKF